MTRKEITLKSKRAQRIRDIYWSNTGGGAYDCDERARVIAGDNPVLNSLCDAHLRGAIRRECEAHDRAVDGEAR